MPSVSSIYRNLKRAKAIAQCSDFPRQRLGAILVKGNKVLAVGYNQTKTYPIQKKYNKYRNFVLKDPKNNGVIHAEMVLLQKTKYDSIDWPNVILYVSREDRDGNWKIARPCEACLEAIKDRGIKTVYYSIAENEFGMIDLTKDEETQNKQDLNKKEI